MFFPKQIISPPPSEDGSTGGFKQNHIPSASSHARPAPKPRPTQAGQALRLNSSTENMTPKERPREERMIMDEMARSHCYAS